MNKLGRLSRIILFIRVQFRTGAGRNQNIRILNPKMDENQNTRIQVHPSIPSILEYKDTSSSHSQYGRIPGYRFILVSQNTRIQVYPSILEYKDIGSSQYSRIQRYRIIIVFQNTRIQVLSSMAEYKDIGSSQYPRIQRYRFILVSQNTRTYRYILVSQNTKILVHPSILE